MAKNSWPLRFAVTDDGLDIAYTVESGSSPPFLGVVSMGTPGRMSWGLIPCVAQFCAHFLRGSTYFEFDWRGSGLSTPPKAPLNLDSLVRDIAAVADVIGEPFHLLAFGPASVPAVAFARRHPDALLGVVLDIPNRPSSAMFGWHPEMDEDAYEQWCARSLRYWFDFPPDVVAGGLLPLFQQDNPFPLFDEWCRTVDAADMLSGTATASPVPAFIHTHSEYAEEATEFAEALPGAHITVGRSYPFNGIRGGALRDAFDEFWCAAHGHEEPFRHPNGSTGLSPRELDVLRLLAAGRANKEIAAALTLSLPTVATHVRHILQKTDTANRAEATAYAVRHGLA